MSNELAEAIGIIVLAIGGLGLPIGVFVFAAPPKWLEDWMDEKAANREKRRALRHRRKKLA